jgi:hypothetical protein
MRTTCTARTPDLTIENEETKESNITHMACPIEAKRADKRFEKIRK